MSTSPRISPKDSSFPFPRAPLAAAAVLLFAFVSHLSAEPDAVGSLIDSENAAYQEWLSSAEDPPVAYVGGDKGAVEIYSPSFSPNATGLLCHDLDVAELVAASGGDPSAVETVVNFGLPRVRTLFGDACLVRPGDRVIAVGEGRNEERLLGKFVVRREKAACPNVPPLALYAVLDRPLDSAPLFFAFDPALAARETAYTALQDLKKAALPAAANALITKLVTYPEDFRIDAWALPGSSTETIVALTRRQPSTEDDQLPSMILDIFDGVKLVPLWTERVDLTHGSGGIEIHGVSDFDSDGRPEIIVDGVHQKCPYRSVFSAGSGGWAPLPLPVKRCGC